MSVENALDDFIEILGKLAPGVEAAVDASADPNGETFIDIKSGAFSTEVSYRPAFGFGIYIKPGEFGQRPDEIFRRADKAATRVLQLRDAFEKDGLVGQLTLDDMQALVGAKEIRGISDIQSYLQQIIQLIEKMNEFVQQDENNPNQLDKMLQKLEEKLQVETFTSQILAMGGRVEMSVVFEEMEARLELPLVKN